jgi:hypothetical protein
MQPYEIVAFMHAIQWQATSALMAANDLDEALRGYYNPKFWPPPHDPKHSPEERVAQLERWQRKLEESPDNLEMYQAGTWFSLQNLIAATANLSKLLWGLGPPPKGPKAARRTPLRDRLGVTDLWSLAARQLRDDLEHMDQRIEKWAEESRNRNFIDGTIGPVSDFGGGEGVGPYDRFRHYDPTTQTVYFWGNRFDIASVLPEIRNLANRSQEFV